MTDPTYFRNDGSRRVYVPNKGGHDFSDASRFGDVIFITEGPLKRYALQEFYRICIDKMKDAQSDDLIVITSLTSICMVAAAIMARKFGSINVLIFKQNKYTVQYINIDALLDLDAIEIPEG